MNALTVMSNTTTTSPANPHGWPLPDMWIIVVGVSVTVGLVLILAMCIKCWRPECCTRKKKEYTGYFAPPLVTNEDETKRSHW